MLLILDGLIEETQRGFMSLNCEGSFSLAQLNNDLASPQARWSLMQRLELEELIWGQTALPGLPFLWIEVRSLYDIWREKNLTAVETSAVNPLIYAAYAAVVILLIAFALFAHRRVKHK